MDTMGHKLMVARHDARLTQGELADKAGLSRQAISDIERGERTDVKLSTIRSLCDVLGMRPSELIETTEVEA